MIYISIMVIFLGYVKLPEGGSICWLLCVFNSLFEYFKNKLALVEMHILYRKKTEVLDHFSYIPKLTDK